MNENARRAGKLFVLLIILGFFMAPSVLAESAPGDLGNVSPVNIGAVNQETDYFAKLSNLGGQLYLLLTDLWQPDAPVYVIPVSEIFVVNNTTNVTATENNSTVIGGGGAVESVAIAEQPEVAVVTPASIDEAANKTDPVNQSASAAVVEDIPLEIEAIPETEVVASEAQEEQQAFAATAPDIESDPVTTTEEVDPVTKTSEDVADHVEVVQKPEEPTVSSNSPVTYVTENNVTRAELGHGGGVTTSQAAKDAQAIAGSLGARIDAAPRDNVEPKAPSNSTSPAEATAKTIVAEQAGKFTGSGSHQPVCLGNCDRGVSSRTEAAAATNIAAVSSAFT